MEGLESPQPELCEGMFLVGTVPEVHAQYLT